MYCSEHCVERLCDQISGECIKGCKSGYTGDKCDAGKYWCVLTIKFTLLQTNCFDVTSVEKGTPNGAGKLAKLDPYFCKF